MRKLLLFLGFLYCATLSAQVGIQVGVDTGDYYDDDDEGPDFDAWYGPGWYYGFWFGTQDEYWGWQRNNPNWRHDHGGHGWHNHGGGEGHHGGGGGEGHQEGGGGHSGGGHGGGGHH